MFIIARYLSSETARVYSSRIGAFTFNIRTRERDVTTMVISRSFIYCQAMLNSSMTMSMLPITRVVRTKHPDWILGAGNDFRVCGVRMSRSPDDVHIGPSQPLAVRAVSVGLHKSTGLDGISGARTVILIRGPGTRARGISFPRPVRRGSGAGVFVCATSEELTRNPVCDLLSYGRKSVLV